MMKDLASKELQEDRTVRRVAEVEGIGLQSLGWGRDADTRVSLLFPYICARTDRDFSGESEGNKYARAAGDWTHLQPYTAEPRFMLGLAAWTGLARRRGVV